MISFFSAGLKISKGEIIVLNVMLPELRVRKVEVAVMKSVAIQPKVSLPSFIVILGLYLKHSFYIFILFGYISQYIISYI